LTMTSVIRNLVLTLGSVLTGLELLTLVYVNLALVPPVTRSTVASVLGYSVHALRPVHAGLRLALIDVGLTVSPFKSIKTVAEIACGGVVVEAFGEVGPDVGRQGCHHLGRLIEGGV